MACWPPCPPWCTCVDGKCQPTPPEQRVNNAIRLKIPGGGYLQAFNGGPGWLVETNTATPGLWETFSIEAPVPAPLTSGSWVVLRNFVGDWDLGPWRVRVTPTVRVLPKPSKKDPQLWTYQFGGEFEYVRVDGPKAPGSDVRTYPGNDIDTNEFTFRLDKVGGSPGNQIVTGDLVTITFGTSNPNIPRRSWRWDAGGTPAHVVADSEPGGPGPSTFEIELSEVRSGLGWRPENVRCRVCAPVVVTVSRSAGGAPIAGAIASAEMASPPWAPWTGTADANGRASLSAFADGADRTCVPLGPIQLVVSADRYQTRHVSDTVLDQDSPTNIAVQLDCTMVTGKVVNQNDVAVPGTTVILYGPNGVPLRDLANGIFSTRTDLNGNFSFACVPHGYVKVVPTLDTTAAQEKTSMGPEGWTNVKLRVQTAAVTLTVVVTDATTGAPVAGAQVTVTTSDNQQHSLQTDANGRATFPNLRPSGMGSVLVDAPGYAVVSPPVAIAAGGTQTVNIQLTPTGPIQPVTAFVAQLDWGASPRDLDLHMSGPTQAGGRFHCYYGDPNPVPYAALTPPAAGVPADDTSGTGPERIVVSQVGGAFVPGEYRVWVHHFADPPPPSMDASGATVALLSLDGASLPSLIVLLDALNAAGAPQEIWFVATFTIDAAGQVTAQTSPMTFQAGGAGTQL